MGCASLPIGASTFHATITSADASTAVQVLAGTSGKSIYLTDVVISTDSALTLQLEDSAGTPNVLVEDLFMPATSVWSKTWSTPIPVIAGNDLNVLASGAGNISVTVTGYIK
jgi:hypothetical protein